MVFPAHTHANRFLDRPRKPTTTVTEKTGTKVTIPILKVLADTLTAGPCGDLAFIVGPSGQPMTKADSTIQCMIE
jgi:hypothetical protein